MLVSFSYTNTAVNLEWQFLVMIIEVFTLQYLAAGGSPTPGGTALDHPDILFKHGVMHGYYHKTGL